MRMSAILLAWTAACVSLPAGAAAAQGSSGTSTVRSARVARPLRAENEILWQHSFEQALQRAGAQKKLLMAYFYPTNFRCFYCVKLGAETFPNPEVVAESRKFVCVKVDATNHPHVARRYRVEGYPAIRFVSANGTAIHRIDGFAPPERYLSAMAEAQRLEDAFRRLEAAWKATPTDARLAVDLGKRLLQRGSARAAMDKFAAARRLDPENRLKLRTRIEINESIVHLKAGRVVPARKLLERIEAGGSGHAPQAAFLLAISRLDGTSTTSGKRKRHVARAVRELEGAARKYPRSEWGRRAARTAEHLSARFR